ncbi:MAG TPA: hypothetical protein VK789_10650 [Bryobacteraceae bacterium]|nr:hypothetical protein [Bryobacteraceae bacterium]
MVQPSSGRGNTQIEHRMTATNIVIGGTGIEVASNRGDFLAMLERQYAEFASPVANSSIRLTVDVVDQAAASAGDEDLRVQREAGCWSITRGDFEARYDQVRRRGTVRQDVNRHSIDSVIRIIHTLALASEGGLLLHAASAIRNGSAFVFAGRSGAGKTTLSRHAPADACLLSDEISYVRKAGETFLAWGTPFTGELGTPGANQSAPVKALCFLRQAEENRLVPIEKAEALRQLLTNVLFFADDPDMVRQVFDTAGELVGCTETFQLNFTQGGAAWELIQ